MKMPPGSAYGLLAAYELVSPDATCLFDWLSESVDREP